MRISLPWAQVVAGSNPAAPTSLICYSQKTYSCSSGETDSRVFLIYPLVYPGPRDTRGQ